MAQTFYERMRDVAKSLTTNYNTGEILLKRPTNSIQESDAVWTADNSARTYDEYRLDAVVMGVLAEYIKDTTVTMDDLMVITSSFATLIEDDEETPNVVLEYDMTDEIYINDKMHAIKKIDRIPSSGVASGWLIYVCR